MNIAWENLSESEQRLRINMGTMATARSEFLSSPAVMLGLVPKPDGDQWSVLYGENLQDGVCGFGDTPAKAMADFDYNWHSERCGPKKEG